MTIEIDTDINKAFPPTESRRMANQGAEKWIGRKVELLDHGFVYLVDIMGSDEAIEQAARVSYGGGTRKASQTEGLLRYLMRHKHTSPFEMAELKFHARMPIFVARQWVRHRTANINEESGRYSILKDEFYIPEVGSIAKQSLDNKQGRGALFDEDEAEIIQAKLEESYKIQKELYHYFLNDDGTGKPEDENRGMLAREIARLPLPVSTYTEWYWKVDLHNLLHFLALRKDTHAQQEIRIYADAIGDIVKDAFPITWRAFEDYTFNAISLSGPEQSVLIDLLAKHGIIFDADQVIRSASETGLKNKSEQNEMLEKLRKVGIIK